MELTLETFLTSVAMLNADKQSLIHWTDKKTSDKQVSLFYPKNFFTEEREPEVILLFENNKIWRISLDSGYRVQVYNIEDIVYTQFTAKRDGSHAELTIEFRNGCSINFCSERDTNAYWTRKYKKRIEEWFDYVSR